MNLFNYLEVLVSRDVLYNHHLVELYKNPKTINKMMPWMRGIIMRDGDLYVLEIDEETREDAVLHTDIIKHMNKVVPDFQSHYEEYANPMDYLNYFITVDRNDNTNTFSLAESYSPDEVEEEMEVFEEYKIIFETKNPQFTLELEI